MIDQLTPKVIAEGLVKAAVELVIVRNDLNVDDGEEGLLSPESIRAYANDTWDAMNGIGTCSGEVAHELMQFQAQAAELERLRALATRLAAQCEDAFAWIMPVAMLSGAEDGPPFARNWCEVTKAALAEARAANLIK